MIAILNQMKSVVGLLGGVVVEARTETVTFEMKTEELAKEIAEKLQIGMAPYFEVVVDEKQIVVEKV